MQVLLCISLHITTRAIKVWRWCERRRHWCGHWCGHWCWNRCGFRRWHWCRHRCRHRRRRQVLTEIDLVLVIWEGRLPGAHGIHVDDCTAPALHIVPIDAQCGTTILCPSPAFLQVLDGLADRHAMLLGMQVLMCISLHITMRAIKVW